MFTVFLIDNDPGLLTTLSRLLQPRGHHVEPFTSAQAFLRSHDPSMPGCIVVEVSMPGLGGLELQNALHKRGSQRPVIFMSGDGDIPTCVRAMRAGAVDFLTKPVDEKGLLAAIRIARKRDLEARRTNANLESIKARFQMLTKRQHEVMRQVISGKINRQIADLLGTGEKVVKVHRGQIMKKLNVRSVADLVRLAEAAGIFQKDP